MAAAPPLTLDVPDGGEGKASIACVGVAGEPVTLSLVVSRDWVDLLIGTTDGGSDISREDLNAAVRRLAPGVHLLTFTPTAATFYITIRRDVRGLCAVTDMHFVAVEADLVLETPYDEEDLRSLRFAQSRDFRWIWVASQMPRALIRYSNTSWGLAVYRSDDGPFAGVNDSTIELTPGERYGSDVALVASRDVFVPGHVGTVFQLTHLGQLVEEFVDGADEWSDPIRVADVGLARRFRVEIEETTFVGTVSLQRSVGTDYNWATVDNWTGTFAGNVDDGFDNAVVYYRIGIAAGNYTSGDAVVRLTYAAGVTVGVCRVIDVTDGQNATVDIVVPFASVEATRQWQEGAWSTERGWPAAGDLFDGRLWLGSVLGVYASKPDNFSSYAIGVGADGDAINRQIATGDASPIRWVKGAFRLLLGTDAGSANIDAVRIGEALSMQIRSSSFDEPLTPTNMSIREVNAKVAFVDSSGSKLLRLSFDLETSSFVPDDLNRLHATIGFDGRGFIDLAYQARPFPRLWLPRADGQLAVLTLAESEQVVGWSRVVLGKGSAHQTYLDELADAAEEAGEDPAAVYEDEFVAEVESVGVTPGVDGTAESDQDFVHVMVRRMIGGSEVRWHERVVAERWRDQADACFLEAATWYEGEATRYLFGLDRFFGESVSVWGDGAEIEGGPFEVVDLSTLDEAFVDGEIGIDLGEGNEVERAWIGLPMRTRYMSGKLAYGAQAGSSVGEPKKIDHITILFHNTALGGVSIGIVDGEDPDPFGRDERGNSKLMSLPDIAEGFTTDSQVALFSGELTIGNALHSFSFKDPRVVIEISGCGPAAILGYVVNMTTQETG